jgi:precorrin-6B methylase 2
MRLVQKAHSFISSSLTEGATAIDMTCGNGMDTLYLSTSVGKSGKVFAFDKQGEAISRTEKILIDNECYDQVELTKACHSEMEKYLPLEIKESVSAISINLGYLPKGDHSIITTAKTTIPALELAYKWMKSGAAMTIIAYRGHQGGEAEARAINILLKDNEWDYIEYKGNMKKDSPILYMITKS